MPTTRRFFLTGASQRATEPVAITPACLARRDVHCQSCADACPVQAIAFRPRIGGPPLPTILPNRCTACGDCLRACPVDAIKYSAHV